MWSYVIKRVFGAIPTVFAVVTLCFIMLQLAPGGPFDGEKKIAPEVLANLEAKYHLNEPLHVQFGYYINNLLHGDLGASFRYADWTVNQLVAQALPKSAAIGGSCPADCRGTGYYPWCHCRPAPEQHRRLLRDVPG